MTTRQKVFTQQERGALIVNHWASEPYKLFDVLNSFLVVINTSHKTGVDFQIRVPDDSNEWMTIETVSANESLWAKTVTKVDEDYTLYCQFKDMGSVEMRVVIQSVIGENSAAVDRLSVLISNELTVH